MDSTCVTLYSTDGAKRMYGIAEVATSAEEEWRLMDREVAHALAVGIDVAGIEFKTVNW